MEEHSDFQRRENPLQDDVQEQSEIQGGRDFANDSMGNMKQTLRDATGYVFDTSHQSIRGVRGPDEKQGDGKWENPEATRTERNWLRDERTDEDQNLGASKAGVNSVVMNKANRDSTISDAANAEFTSGAGAQ